MCQWAKGTRKVKFYYSAYRIFDLVDVVVNAILLLHLGNMCTFRIPSNQNRFTRVSLKDKWNEVSKENKKKCMDMMIQALDSEPKSGFEKDILYNGQET